MESFDRYAIAQFENMNELRSYPLVDGSRLESADGEAMPDGMLADVHVVIPSSGQDPSFASGSMCAKVSSVHVSPAMVSVCVSAYRQGDLVAALAASVSMDRFVPHMPYRMSSLHGFRGCGGVVTFGDFEVPGRPVTYSIGDAVLCDACVAEIIQPAVKSFVDQRSGESASGDVSIEFSGHIEASEAEGGIKLSLADGSAAELVSSCAKDMQVNPCGATPIKSINGVSPDEQGRIVLWFR